MLALALSAELNGLTNLRPLDTEEQPFHYTFTVQCTSCREEHPKWVTLTRFEKNQLSGSRGEANFVWKCKNCKREHSANIIEAPKAYEVQEPAKLVNILQLDCRGLEFLKFRPDGNWTAIGKESGTEFVSINFTDGEYYDYDEKAKDEVSIKIVEWNVRRS